MITVDSEEINKKAEEKIITDNTNSLNIRELNGHSDSSTMNFHLNPIYADLLDKDFFDKKYYRSDEIGKITFSINGLKKLLDELRGYDVKKFHDKKLLKLFSRNETCVNNTFGLGKGEYAIPKTSVAPGTTVKDIYDGFYNSKLRTEWDKGVKQVKLLETISESNPKAYIYHTWCKSPLILISEREFIEKRVEIVEDKYAILFASALPLDSFPENKKVIRCLNYINVQLVEEKQDYFLLTNYSQTDLKMPIPESFLNFTLPSKFNSWYSEFTKYLAKPKK